MNRERINMILKNCDKERTMINKELDSFKGKPNKTTFILGFCVGIIVTIGGFYGINGF